VVALIDSVIFATCVQDVRDGSLESLHGVRNDPDPPNSAFLNARRIQVSMHQPSKHSARPLIDGVRQPFAAPGWNGDPFHTGRPVFRQRRPATSIHD